MIKVMQTEFGDRGNCWSACLASMLECSIEDVPNFVALHDDNEWWLACRAWLERTHGVTLLTVNKPRDESLIFEGHSIVGGRSRRERGHAVIYKDNELVHDPHPDGGGLEEIEDYSFLVAKW